MDKLYINDTYCENVSIDGVDLTRIYIVKNGVVTKGWEKTQNKITLIYTTTTDSTEITSEYKSVTELGSFTRDNTSLKTAKVIMEDYRGADFSCSYLFYGCKNITSINMSEFDMSKCTNTKSMFNNCQKLTTVDVSSWDTGSVIDMSDMFNNCLPLTAIDVSKWDTSSVTNMKRDVYGLLGAVDDRCI